MSKRAPFPLQWPEGWARAKWRSSSKFDKSGGFNASRDGVLNQLKLLGASHVVITSNLPTTSSGVPYSTSSGQLPDPGIAVWWVKAGKEQVMPCDRWRTCVENMHAIELSIAAIRGIDRWGTAGIVERAFAGFAALPAAGETSNGTHVPPAPRERPWRDVLGETFAPWPALDADELLDLARSRHRKLMKLLHPDVGGSHEAATDLNVAIAAAEKELG